HSYMMRTSDCPSLKRKPSEYMREMFYSSQPMEKPRDRSILEATFKMINAETQLMWSSDYPHWDFDLPSVVYDLPFLSETGRRNILGGTAAKVFGLDPKPVKKIPSPPTANDLGRRVAGVCRYRLTPREWRNGRARVT